MTNARRWWSLWFINSALCAWNAFVLHDGEVLAGTIVVYFVLSFSPWRDAPSTRKGDPVNTDRLIELRSEYRHLLDKCIDARRGGRDSWAPQSTGEKLAVALVLNKAEWLREMDYTIADALQRIGPDWVYLIGPAQAALRELEEVGAFGNVPPDEET